MQVVSRDASLAAAGTLGSLVSAWLQYQMAAWPGYVRTCVVGFRTCLIRWPEAVQLRLLGPLLQSMWWLGFG